MDDLHTLVTTRDIAAPVEKVWDAWTDPEKIARWWGPAGFQSTVNQLDVLEGGHFEVVMHGPDGRNFRNLYLFDRVEPFKQIVFTHTGSQQYGLAPFQSVFDMERIGNRTRVVLTARFRSEEDKRRHVEDFRAVEGSQQLLQRLEEQAG